MYYANHSRVHAAATSMYPSRLGIYYALCLLVDKR